LRFWWVAWRSDAVVRIHQQFILPERLEGVIDSTPTRTPYEIIDSEPDLADSDLTQ